MKIKRVSLALLIVSAAYRNALTLVTAGALLSICGNAHATLLSVDFQNSNGAIIPGITQAGFVAFDNTNVTGIGTANATYSTTGGEVTVLMTGIDPAASLEGFYNRGGVDNGGDLTLANVYNDFAFTNGASPQSMTLALSGDGIDASADYLLTFYSSDTFQTQGRHSVAFAGITGTVGSAGPITYSTNDLPTTNDQHATKGTFTADRSGVLTIDMTDTFSEASGLTGIRLNAFEISAVPDPLTLTLTAMDPTTADVVIDADSDTQFGIVILPHPGTLGVLNHPGEPDGNLDMWFTVTGLTELLTEGELDDLASNLRDLDGILDAQRVAPADSPDHIPVDANLMVTFDGGASAGQSTAIQYDFGPDVRMVVFAVPEPTTLSLTALGLFGLVARGRRRRAR